MKKLILFISSFFFVGYVSAQNFQLIANDVANDNMQPGMPDIKSLSYAIDKAKDSLWLKVETHNAYMPTADFGIMFAIDTNLNVNDGRSWSGSTMKYDHAIFIYQGFGSGYIGELGFASTTATDRVQLPVNVKRPDNKTFIIRMKLTTIDKNGDFNIVAAASDFLIPQYDIVYDKAPDNGYASVKTTTSVDVVKNNSFLFAYPNPVSDKVHVVFTNASGNVKLSLYDSRGELVMIKKYENKLDRFTAELNVLDLPIGIYTLYTEDSGHKIMQKILKQE